MRISFLSILFISAVLALSASAQAAPPGSYAPLVKRTGPAVVNIYAKRVVQERAQVVSPFFNDPFFNQFFNAPQFGGPVRDRIENSLGSGVIVDETGIIATNVHVIKDATEISVVTSDGREFPAQKMLLDPRTDLAILKIDAKGAKLPTLELADSDAVEVGDVVLAIGNPFGVGQTVTSGIVSAVARTDVGISDYSFFIQTDAAINPGNSGGALIDTEGHLIGVNSAIYSRDGGSLGIGFAIPANMLKTVIEAAHHGSRIVRPWTGLSGQAVTADMVESLGLSVARGALINKVYPKSPADRAGIKQGDVVLSINGKDVQDPNALKFRLATVALGSPVAMKVWRAGKTIDTTMTAEAPPENPPRDEAVIEGLNPVAGATVVNISPALIEDLGAVPQEEGVVVLNAGNGIAARLGIQRGDIVLLINGAKVDSTKTLRAVLAKGAQRWQVQIQRGVQVINLSINQ